MTTFMGMKIVVDHTGAATRPPKMTLAPQGIGPGKVYVSAHIREMMDDWMLQFFGRKSIVLKMDGVLVMHPDDIAALRLANGKEPYVLDSIDNLKQGYFTGARP